MKIEKTPTAYRITIPARWWGKWELSYPSEDTILYLPYGDKLPPHIPDEIFSMPYDCTCVPYCRTFTEHLARTAWFYPPEYHAMPDPPTTTDMSLPYADSTVRQIVDHLLYFGVEDLTSECRRYLYATREDATGQIITWESTWTDDGHESVREIPLRHAIRDVRRILAAAQ